MDGLDLERFRIEDDTFLRTELFPIAIDCRDGGVDARQRDGMLVRHEIVAGDENPRFLDFRQVVTNHDRVFEATETEVVVALGSTPALGQMGYEPTVEAFVNDDEPRHLGSRLVPLNSFPPSRGIVNVVFAESVAFDERFSTIFSCGSSRDGVGGNPAPSNRRTVRKPVGVHLDMVEIREVPSLPIRPASASRGRAQGVRC